MMAGGSGIMAAAVAAGRLPPPGAGAALPSSVTDSSAHIWKMAPELPYDS
jgi:hypothetical protein